MDDSHTLDALPLRPRQTKMVCTLGPSVEGRAEDLVRAGMDVARVNFSHGTDDDRRRAFADVRRAEDACGRPVAILADLQGPKVRLGELNGGRAGLETGSQFVLRTSGSDGGDASGASVSHPGLAGDLHVGDRVLLADGAAVLSVVETRTDEVVCDVERGGAIRSRAGVNVPSERLSVPGVTDKDRDDIRKAVALGADLIAQSFVRTADDVRALRESCDEDLFIVAKIETNTAVRNFDAICDEADAVMIARGDLGVQLAYEEIPVLQKDLVRRATAAGVPSIVATQMLESMVRVPHPTRAEASDVANAVLDGTDALLLSAETAIGKHPVEAAQTAGRIAHTAERHGASYIPTGERRTPSSGPQSIARAASGIAIDDPEVNVIGCFTRSGRTAELVSAVRPGVGVYAFTPDADVARRLTLFRAVVPAICDVPEHTDAMIEMMDERLRSTDAVGVGARVVLVASTPVGKAKTNLLKIHRVGD